MPLCGFYFSSSEGYIVAFKYLLRPNLLQANMRHPICGYRHCTVTSPPPPLLHVRQANSYLAMAAGEYSVEKMLALKVTEP